MKKILLWAVGIIAAIILISAAGGWIWMQQAMKPGPNEVHADDGLIALEIEWTSTEFSERGALLLPVTLPGVEGTFYMQFDLGAPSTIFYEPTISSLQEAGLLEPWLREQEEPEYARDIEFFLGGLSVQMDRARMYPYGNSVTEDPDQIRIIGTIGSDFARRKTIMIDFVDSIFFAGDPSSFATEELESAELRVVAGWVQTRVQIDGRDKWMMWDTGASAFRLITSQKTWTRMASNLDAAQSFEVNSVGRMVTAHLVPTDEIIIVGESPLDLVEVAYIEGFPWYVEALMGLSGMEGMLGNAVFEDHVVILNLAEDALLIAPGGNADQYIHAN